MKVLALCMVLLGTCQGFLFPKIKTVDELEVDKYTGRWYEVKNVWLNLKSKSFSLHTGATVSILYNLNLDAGIKRLISTGKYPGPKQALCDLSLIAT